MENIISNWPLIIVAIAMVIVALNFVISFFQKPTSQQKQQIFQWLIWCTAEAEKIFGGNTGQLKLRYVYDKFLERFDYLAKLFSFDQFSELVDKALTEMKRLLSDNKSMQEYVGVTIESKTEDQKEETSES